jgi:hypothetical protein
MILHKSKTLKHGHGGSYSLGVYDFQNRTLVIISIPSKFSLFLNLRANFIIYADSGSHEEIVFMGVMSW